jgi:hypothetical protein
LPIVIFLSFGRGNVTDELQQSMVVEPGFLFKRGQLLRLLGLPRYLAVYQFGLV